jgi:serine/threonine protein kinase
MQFDLIAEIGRGAFGRVFLANEPLLGNRQIVVKVAPRGGEEADMLGKLQHPNIVPVYSLQEDEETGLAAFCMPYLGRATLCNVLDHAFADRRCPTEARTILDAIEAANEGFDASDFSAPPAVLRAGSYVDGVIYLGVQLAEGLAHSHGRGIYHRDLKPSNVLMSPDGSPLLLDFNLSVDNRFLAGRIGGTVPYMAPEELAALYGKPGASRGRFYDPRSDIFSLGAILHQLLTGALPFGEIPWNLPVDELARHLHQRQEDGPTPLRTLNGQVDSQLSRLIESCLAFEPEQRPESARALADGLRRQLSPLRRSRRWMGNHRKLVAGMAAILLTSVLAIALFLALRPPYSVRQLQSGLECSRQGQYALAIDYLSSSIHADPSSAGAFFARGKAHQRLGEFSAAAEDYHSAHERAPQSLFAACEGYCWSRAVYHGPAIGAYQEALKENFASPALLYNNMGREYLRLAQLDEAEKCLRRAVDIDGRLQAAHCNLVQVFVERACRGQPVSTAAFTAASRALEIGPCTGELYRDVAALYALAARRDPTLIRTATDFVKKAIECGVGPRSFASNSSFSALTASPAFRDALRTSASASHSPAASLLLDPLDRL